MEKATTTQIDDVTNEEVIFDLVAPEEGKVWRRKIDGTTYRGFVKLGEIWMLNGMLLETPIKETVEDYELIDLPIEEPTEEVVR